MSDAQNLIDETEALFTSDLFKTFYPTLYKLKQADENITKCLKLQQ